MVVATLRARTTLQLPSPGVLSSLNHSLKDLNLITKMFWGDRLKCMAEAKRHSLLYVLDEVLSRLGQRN